MDTYPVDHDRDHSTTSTQDIEKDESAINEVQNGGSKPFDDRAANRPLDGGAVEKQMTGKSANPSVNNISAIPNGGTVAWLQVLGAFFLFFNSWVRTIRLPYRDTRQVTI